MRLGALDARRRRHVRSPSDGKPVHLTPREFEVLKVLVTHAGRLVTHGRLLRAVWGTAYSDEAHYVHVYVSQIRRKLAAADPTAAARPIVTEPGVGYRVAAERDPTTDLERVLERAAPVTDAVPSWARCERWSRGPDGTARWSSATLDRETELLTSAIDLVASGARRRRPSRGLRLDRGGDRDRATRRGRPAASSSTRCGGRDEEGTDVLVRR